MKTITALLVIVMFSFGFCQELEDEQEPQVYCGRRLADTLEVLCESVNNMVRRSGSNYGPMKHHFEIPRVMNVHSHARFPWIAPRQARALGTMRGKRQIVSECCDKACTIDELLTYC